MNPEDLIKTLTDAVHVTQGITRHPSLWAKEGCPHSRVTYSGDENHEYMSCVDCDYYEEL